MENANQKHLTLEDRNYIEQALNHGMTSLRLVISVKCGFYF